VALEWAPRADSDVMGTLFILPNGPRLFAAGMAAGLGSWPSISAFGPPGADGTPMWRACPSARFEELSAR
jgi:hypothetical protein